MENFTVWLGDNLWVIIVPVALLAGVIIGSRRGRNDAGDSETAAPAPPPEPTKAPAKRPQASNAAAVKREPAAPADDRTVFEGNRSDDDTDMMGLGSPNRAAAKAPEVPAAGGDDGTILLGAGMSPVMPEADATRMLDPRDAPDADDAGADEGDRTELFAPMGDNPATEKTMALNADEIAAQIEATAAREQARQPSKPSPKAQQKARPRPELQPEPEQDAGDVTMITGLAPDGDKDDDTFTSVGARVEFAAFSKQSVRPGEMFILDVWAYLGSQYFEILDTADAMRRNKELSHSDGAVVEGVVSVHLQVPGMGLEVPYETLAWSGKPGNVSFFVKVPESFAPGSVNAQVSVSCEGALIARLRFDLEVATTAKETYSDRGAQAFYPRTAFACHTANDVAEVMSRVDSLHRLAPDLDVHLEGPGRCADPEWRKALKEVVPGMDVFYLFWSEAARGADCVENEWRYALATRGLEYIDPIPLADPSVCAPPHELKDLDFQGAFRAQQAGRRHGRR